MGRFRDALSDQDAPPSKVSAPDVGDLGPDMSEGQRRRMMRHALGLAHYLNKMKKSGQFKKAGARGR